MPITRYDEQRLELIASEVVSDLQSATKPTFQTPSFFKLPTGSRANAILLCCVVERYIKAELKGDRSKTKEAWSELASASLNKPELFDPASILSAEKDAWQAALASAAPMPNIGWATQLRELVRGTGETLASGYHGDASRLAKVGPLTRAATVERRLLRDFDAFKLDVPVDNRSNARVFLKVAIRESVWPGMAPGPFMVPWSKTVARCIINTGCLRGFKKEEELTAADPRVENLIAGAVVNIARRCVPKFNKLDFEIRKRLSDRCHLSDPYFAKTWHMTEAVDFWLWDRGGTWCDALAKGRPTAEPCNLNRVANAGCLCERNGKRLVVAPKDPHGKA